MNWDTFLLFDALALAAAAAFIDVRCYRIPNWLTYSGIGIGVLLRSVCFGWKGLGSALAGCLFAGAVVFLFYMVRAMGAGDVKLLGAIGSIVGPSHVVVLLLATAICGGMLAVIYAVFNRRMGATLRNIRAVLQFHFFSGIQAHPQLNLDNPNALRMPYGLAIAAGTMCVFLETWWRS